MYEIKIITMQVLLGERRPLYNVRNNADRQQDVWVAVSRSNMIRWIEECV